MERLNAVVTAGGTTERIDDVRVMTNVSTGRFGHALAAELAAQGIETTELCPVSTTDRLGENDDVTYEHFYTTEDLQRQLVDRKQRPDIILHAAAVSDYTPLRIDGKISSDNDTLTIEMKRNPKIIGELRGTYGSEAFIAGFKLLSGVSEIDLITAAMKQLKKNRLNMVVANDLQNLRDGRHPLLAVTAEGGVVPFEGERAKVAQELAAFILRRVNVGWFRSEQAHEIAIKQHYREDFNELLDTVHDMHLLTDESGNISVNVGDGLLLVSPRQVDKSRLSGNDAVPVVVDAENQTVFYAGDRKPSIDTGVSELLYREYPDLDGIIHFHNGWGRMEATSKFPYPCGVVEEAEEMIDSMRDANAENVAIELVHHGFLIGLRSGDKERLEKEWRKSRDAFVEHLKDVGTIDYIDQKQMRPIFDGLSIAGTILDRPEGSAVFLNEKARGCGLGNVVVRQLIKRQQVIQTVDDCEVRDFYKKHGFTEVFDSASQSYLLTPPSYKREREFEL